MSAADYLIRLDITAGAPQPSALAVRAAFEVGAEGAPEDTGLEAISQVLAVDALDAQNTPAALLAQIEDLKRLASQNHQRSERYARALRAIVNDVNAMACRHGTIGACEHCNVAMRPHPRQDDIDFFRANGFTWEYPGFLSSHDVPGYDFTVGLDERDTFTVQVMTRDGGNTKHNTDINTREEVLAYLQRLKGELA